MYYSCQPSQNLNGNWLEEAGFSTDTPVTVSVELGRLVIEPVRGLQVKIRAQRWGRDLCIATTI